ncbi:MBL fold metallo-hydrolase [Sneathiella sp. P13V-1]|uniref:MBL fold metallo-hydrolase n=1 Tax=Sneathiella sp. P13V-1 TaxID=2697366 RepID=UPI00187B8794|nr:MBL fold metallo-hydrolase [Sneathiella sp. P13V-1]MBE7638299.1 MBL fold metallo-hydrolase [Sneathiella sp. P13V-1]
MNNKKELTYPLGTRPEPGDVIEVSEGVLWTRIPIPFAGLDFINVYLLEGKDGWTIIDSGVNTSKVRAIWESVFEKHLKGKPVTQMICTHFHPDHVGAATWITEKWGIDLTMSMGEWSFGRMLFLEAQPEVPESVIAFYRKVGLPEKMIDAMRERGYDNIRKIIHGYGNSIIRLDEGQVLEIGDNKWEVIVGQGHSPEHVCLYCEEKGLLISGDQVLPKISPHIGVYPTEPLANPLGKFLGSIDKFRHLPEDTLVLPSHNDVFVGLHNQLDYYESHHIKRLEQLKLACSSPKTVQDILPVLFERKLDENNMGLAMAEALAHCHYLVGTGELNRLVGDDGVWRFQMQKNVQTAVA